MSQIHHECQLERHIVEQLAASGWLVGDSTAYDRARASYPEDVTGWLRDSQPEGWKKLEAMNGAGTEAAVLDRLVKTLENKDSGTVEVLRRGFAMAGAGTLAMSQALPEDDRNATVIARYAANRLRVVRQVHYSVHHENSLDLVLFVNGVTSVKVRGSIAADTPSSFRAFMRTAPSAAWDEAQTR